MKFLSTTSVHIKFLPFLVAYSILCVNVNGQDIAKLKQDQARLAREIAFTNKLLTENSGKKKNVELQLTLINKQIDSRKHLVSSISRELESVRIKQEESQAEVRKLKQQKADLVGNYSTIIKASYRSKLLKNRWLFLLSAHSIPQLYQRWRYLKQLNGGVRKQLTQISATMQSIDTELLALAQIEEEKKMLLQSLEKEKKLMTATLKRQEEAIELLAKEGSRLRSTLRKHQKAQAALSKAILAAINTTTEKRREIPMTPAMVELSQTFASNKNQLPWPVSKGLITRPFGKQQHPTLRNVSIVNNGVDIHTEPATPVMAIFDGKIVGQQFIPGHDHMIIISHGNYYSVYSYLSELSVEVGQDVKTGQQLGRSRSKDGVGQVHLEIWQGKELMDPQNWLKLH